ncbi:MAG: helix-turn-helix transcriptional regulator [Solirubrobacteraceae bacterium]
MRPDVDATPGRADALGVVAAERSQPDLVRSGAELVALSERFYGGVFLGGVVFVGLAALAALVLLPLRARGPSDGALTPAIVVASLLVVASPVAVWRIGPLYRIIRRRRAAEVGLVLLAALLVAYPMRSELWWPSCAIVMLLAIVVPFRRALAYCLLVLAAGFASHAVGGDLREMSAVAIVGLCIGYPFWSAAVAVSTDRLAAYLLRLNATRQRPRPAPRRVAAWTARPPGDPVRTVHDAGAAANAKPVARASPTRLLPSADPTGTIDGGEDEPPAGGGDGGAAIDRLTARQLQVVALLADGLRYREVAACLSISARQVQRHVAQAAARLGVNGAYELAAVAVSDGLVPEPARSREGGSSTQAAEADPSPLP